MKVGPIILLAFILPISMSIRTSRGSVHSRDETNSDLTVTLVLEKNEIRSGEPVLLNVVARNTGSTPLMIGSVILNGEGGTPVSRIEFTLTDSHGNTIAPAVVMIGDDFGTKEAPNTTTAFLSSYLVLHPGYSLSKRFLIDSHLFKELATPGSYKLSATYTSNGLSYPPVYHSVGISDEDAKSVPIKAWTGKIDTNEVDIRVKAASPRR